MTTNAWDGDAPKALISICLCASVMASVLLLAPAVAGQLIVTLGFSEPQAGFTISAELAGISLASIPAYLWLDHWNWRSVATASLAGVTLGNVISIFCVDFEALAAVRFLTALCAGNVMLVTMLAAAGTRNAERSYAFWLIGQLLLGAIGLAVLPAFFARFGLPGFYTGLAIFSLSLLLTVRNLPAGRQSLQIQQDLTAERSSMIAGIVALVGLFLYYIAIGGTWTFAEQVGVGLGAGRQQIGLVLSVATIAGIVGAIAAPMLRTIVSRRTGVAVGAGLLTTSILILALNDKFGHYAVAAVLFKFAWTFTVPFILAALASLDYSGRIITTANVLIGLGLAVGPLLAAFIIAGNVVYAPMLYAMAVAAFVATAALVSVSGRS